LGHCKRCRPVKDTLHASAITWVQTGGCRRGGGGQAKKSPKKFRIREGLSGWARKRPRIVKKTKRILETTESRENRHSRVITVGSKGAQLGATAM